MRHQASLSPIALLRKWRVHTRVNSGALDYSLASIQTAYGRGLSLAAAGVSLMLLALVPLPGCRWRQALWPQPERPASWRSSNGVRRLSGSLQTISSAAAVSIP